MEKTPMSSLHSATHDIFFTGIFFIRATPFLPFIRWRNAEEENNVLVLLLQVLLFLLLVVVFFS